MIETNRAEARRLTPAQTRKLLTEYAALRDAHGAESAQAVTARNRIVEGNLGLIFHVARRHTRILHAEILGIGVPGLIKAVERFDLKRGTAFSTYATWWIRHALSRTSADEGGLVRIPVHVQSPSSKASAECAEAAAAARRMHSLDVPIGDEGGRETFAGQTEDPGALLAFGALEAEEQADALRAAVAQLPERLRKLVEARAAGRMLNDIGRDFGLSRERTRQLEQDAYGRLRRALRDAA